MHLSELKAIHVSELITMGEALEIENVARLRKQELMFAIMKKRAKGGDVGRPIGKIRQGRAAGQALDRLQ